MYIRKTARCNFAERRESIARIVSILDEVARPSFPRGRGTSWCARVVVPGITRRSAARTYHHIAPVANVVERGREGGKGEEDSYVYVRPLVLPSQIHEANIGRKNGVEEVKEPATILLLLLLLPRYRSTRFSPPHDDTTRPVCLNFEETGSRDVFVERKWDRTIFRF